MTKPYTINIFMPDGDPSGLRIITRSGWTGKAIIGPRELWGNIGLRKELSLPGVYILIGADESDQPMIYVGQSDELCTRIDSHHKNKDFWDWLITFTATDNSLNSALVQWLEFHLIQRAQQTKLAKIANSVSPNAPTLREELIADVMNFSEEIYQILPLVGLHCFNIPKIIQKPAASENSQLVLKKREIDTIIIPANPEGFQEVFIGQNAWWSVRIGSKMLPKIKFIAAYQTAPIRAITHLAKVQSIVSFGDTGKYKIIFEGSAVQLEAPIIFGTSRQGTMQGSAYTSVEKIYAAKTLTDLMPFGEI